MSEKSRSVLKSYFVPNAIPDSGNFADLIDSFLDKADDGISVSSLSNIGIGDPNPATNLSLKAHYSALSGSLSAAASSTAVTGVGTRFTTELSVGASFTMAGNACVVASIASDTSLILRDPVPTALAGTGAQVLRDTLSVLDLQGNPTLYIDKTGRIGFRKTPTATFDVAGAVTADSFVGDGSSLSNLQAANLVGVLKKDQIPNIDVSNVSGQLAITADFSRSVAGLASAAAGSSQLTGSGTQFETDFAPGDPLKIGDTVYTIDTIASATALTTRAPFATAFGNQPIFGQSDLLLAQSASDELYMQLDSRGNLGLGKSPTAKLDVDGVAKAGAFVGDGSGLTALSAASLVGIVSAANLPPTSANAVTGELTVTQALDRALAGTVSGAAGSATLIGAGTDFVTDLAAGQWLRVGETVLTVHSIESATSLTLSAPLGSAVASQTAYLASGYVALKSLSGADALLVGPSGDAVFGGAVAAARFSGDGSGLTALSAASLVGIVSAANLPPTSANAVTGQLTVTQALDRALAGTVSGDAGSATLTGAGTDFATDLVAGQQLRVGETVLTAQSIESATSLTLSAPLGSAVASQTAYLASGYVALKSLSGADALLVDPSGDAVFGGAVAAERFSGDGSGLTALSAASLVGIVSAANLPPTSANAVTGELTVTQALDRALAGTVSGDAGSATLTGAGTDFATGLVAGQQLRVGETVLTAQSIESATSLTLSAPLGSAVASQTAYLASGYVALKSLSGADALVVGPSGDALFGGAVSAARFSGDGSGLTALSAAGLVGQVPADSIASVSAAKIQGTLPVAALPPIPASSLTGALSADQLPEIPAAKITGAFPAASLPEIPAAKISGTLAPAQIPALPAGQVASYVEVAVDAPVLATAAPLSLSWKTSGVDALEIAYRSCGAVAKLASGADIALSQNGYSLNLYQDTAITFTARANGAVVCQRQVFVSVIQTLGQYALQLKYDGCDATATVPACAGRYSLRALNPANVTSLATALKQAGYSASDAFQSIPEFYRSQGATWDPAQYTPILAAVFGGVDQATINSYASAMAAQGQTLKQLLPALAQKFGLTTSNASSVQALAVAVKSAAKFTVSDAFQAIPAYYRSIGQPWGPNSPDQGQILLKVFSS